MKRSELLKNLKNAAEEKYDEIIEKIMQAYKDADRADLSGWHIDVLMDDGDIWATGIMSQGTVTQGQWDGSYYTIAHVGTWNALDDCDLAEEVTNHKDYEKISADFEENEGGNRYDFARFVKEKYPEVAEKLEDEYRDAVISEYGNEFAAEKYDEFLKELDIEIENAEYNEANEEVEK